MQNNHGRCSLFFAQINICDGLREIKARFKAIQPDEKNDLKGHNYKKKTFYNLGPEPNSLKILRSGIKNA